MLLCRTSHYLSVLPILASQASAQSFDYIVVGGGTSGLTVANRLSELPNVTVAVIEAGGEVNNNPNVTDVNKFTVALGTDIDWNYESTNQTHAAGQKIAYHGGKALGGSSTINGMTYVRAQKAQIDSWEALGNPGWNWDTLFPYYQKSETFQIPTVTQAEAGASYLPEYHGEQGPLKVGFVYGLQNGSIYERVEAAWASLGIPSKADINGGDVRGYILSQLTIDREANVREDAGRAYYYPVKDRPNLVVFLNTTANKLIWKDSKDVVADGVEIIAKDGTVSVLKANKEIILSTGTLRSSAILELSGIGNPGILSKFGIPTKVPLPGVGENLQDQPNTAFVYSTNTTWNGTMGYCTYTSLSDFLSPIPPANITQWADQISTAINHALPSSIIAHLLKIQYDLLLSGVPDSETFMGSTVQLGLAPSSFLLSAFWLLMPFSRGNIHITSADPAVYPAINPNYFLIDFDLTVQISIAKFMRKFFAASALGVYEPVELSPGLAAVPADASNEVWGEWAKSAFSANSHPLGTTAMMARQLGGVVDSRLKVYGTCNVRVVDAGVLPFQVSGHLTSTLYAIAEKAADMIKEDM